MAKRYILLATIPSLTCTIREKKETRAIVLTPGEGSLSDKDHAAILKLPVIMDMVAEGDLQLPDHGPAEKVFGKTRSAAPDRLDKASAVQLERREKAQENSLASAENADEIAALRKKDAERDAEMETMRAQLKALTEASGGTNDEPPAGGETGTVDIK